MPTQHGLPAPPRKVRSDKGGKHKVKGVLNTKLSPPRGKKQAAYPKGLRADGQPKQPQVSRKGGREYGHLRDGTKLSAGWIVDKEAPTREPPVSRYPDTHPLWLTFVSWVQTSGVVRQDLLDSHPDSKSGKDWEQVWLTFLNGAILGTSIIVGT